MNLSFVSTLLHFHLFTIFLTTPIFTLKVAEGENKFFQNFLVELGIFHLNYHLYG